MRVTTRSIRTSLCAALLVLASACGSSAPPPSAGGGEEARVSGSADLQIFIGPVQRTREEIETEGRDRWGYLDVRNNLDRSVSIDFDGASHYDLTVGDRRTERVKLPAGSYSMAVSAPGLKPAKGRVSLENERVHAVEIYTVRSKE